jgi:hypothetical protein
MLAVGDELRLVLACDLELPKRLAQLVEQSRILDGVSSSIRPLLRVSDMAARAI